MTHISTYLEQIRRNLLPDAGEPNAAPDAGSGTDTKPQEETTQHST